MSAPNNEPTFRLHQKIDKKNEKKLFLDQNFLKRIMSQLLDNTKKMTKSRKKREKLFLAQNCLKRIMSQLLEYTKKLTKNREFEIEKLVLAQNCLKRIMS